MAQKPQSSSSVGVDIDYDYEHINNDQRKLILQQQLMSFEADLFGHQMNLTRLQAQPPTDNPVEKQARENQEAIELRDIKTLKHSISVNKGILKQLG